MLEIILAILKCSCSIAAISALIFKVIAPTKVGEAFWNFMKKHRIVSITYIVMAAIGLFLAIFGN